MEMPQIYRPVPRRTFEFTPASTDSSVPPSPVPEQNPELLAERLNERSSAPSRTRSILNLTSSTLLGIYSKTGTDGTREESNTPWGTGAQTPNLSRLSEADRYDFPSVNWDQHLQKPRLVTRKVPRYGFRRYYLPLFLQTFWLFLFGIGFGTLVTHLQKTSHVAPVPIPAIARTSWYYQVSWGLLGVLVGNALPRIDLLWEDESAVAEGEGDIQKPKVARTRSNASDINEFERRSFVDSGTGPLWLSAVRSIGAFVGIAFALRRIPWQSTLQVSLTLAIANPVLWYLIDRSKSGFALSSLVGVVGTFLLLLVNPDFVPVPAIHHDQISEKVGVYTWLASILFCTSLCFGAVGRKLQL